MLEMLEQRYLVEDDSWQSYPTAKWFAKWEGSNRWYAEFRKGEEPEIEPLVERVADLLGIVTERPQFISYEERKLIFAIGFLMDNMMSQVYNERDLSFELLLAQKRLWLLNNYGKRIMSGYFDNLFVDKENKVGLVVKHDIEEKGHIPIQEDKESLALALIASEALSLKEVMVAILRYQSLSSDFAFHQALSLQIFRQRIQNVLNLIGAI